LPHSFHTLSHSLFYCISAALSLNEYVFYVHAPIAVTTKTGGHGDAPDGGESADTATTMSPHDGTVPMAAARVMFTFDGSDVLAKQAAQTALVSCCMKRAKVEH
jgi:hypothetical protein